MFIIVEMSPVLLLWGVLGEEALRRNRSPTDCKEEKECTEEACSGRDVGGSFDPIEPPWCRNRLRIAAAYGLPLP
jgi:hypothetical protein